MKRIARLVFENSVPWILAIAAMVTTSPGPAEWVGICSSKRPNPTLQAAVTTQQAAYDECKSEARFILILAAFALKFVIDLVNHHFPLWQLARFRRVYLDSSVKPKWEELNLKYNDAVRINIMVARRRWWCLWLYGSFEFDYPLGFSTPNNHHDMKLHLMWHQGVAGAAFRERKVKPEYLPPQDNAGGKSVWKLTRRQMAKTSHVRWILSVPMFKEGKPGEPEKPTARGVINIDVTDDAEAQRLGGDAQEVADLTAYFLKIGRVASHLW